MSESPKWQWDVYYNAVPKTPEETLLRALQLFDGEKENCPGNDRYRLRTWSGCTGTVKKRCN